MRISLNPNRHRQGVLLQCIIALLVLLIGLLLAFKLLRLCDECLPGAGGGSGGGTNSSSSSQSVESSAYIVLSNAPATPDPCNGSFEFYYAVSTNGQCVLGACRLPGEDDFSTVTNYGLPPDMLSSHYNTSAVPMSWSDGVFTLGSGDVTTIVCRSTNMTDWESIATIKMPTGYACLFTDDCIPGERAFYRVWSE